MELIVPTKAIQELSRQLGEEGNVEIQITENQVSFGLEEKQGKGSLIVSKLVEGAYPNYKQVIPAESQHRVTLDKEELFHALRRAEIMTSEKANSVKLTFTENNLTFTANSPEVGRRPSNSRICWYSFSLRPSASKGWTFSGVCSAWDTESMLIS